MRHYLLLTVALVMLAGDAPISPADPTGSAPSGNIVVRSGTIYGATEYGGPNCPLQSSYDVGGCGTVYAVDTSGKNVMLHAFAGPDGSNPSSGVTVGGDGMLYGTTDAGGEHGHGVIYRIAPDGSGFEVLHSFVTGAEHGALTIAPDGTIYGVAPSDHGDGHGATVFALSKNGDYRTLRVFGPESHIAAPLAIDSAGQLYGILVRGGYCGGDVFSLSGNGAYGIVFSNSSPYTSAACADATIPSSPLVEDEGVLYATGPTSLFEVSSAGLQTILTIAPPPHPVVRPPFSPLERTFIDGTLTAAPDGSLLAAAEMTVRPRDCGRIVSFDPATRATKITVLQGDRGCVVGLGSGHSTPFALGTGSDALYAVAQDEVGCQPDPSRYPPICGAVMRIDGDRLNVIAAFDKPDGRWPLWGRYPKNASVSISGAKLPTTLLLTMTAFGTSRGPFYARTGTSRLTMRPAGVTNASPIPIAFEGDTTKLDVQPPRSIVWTGVIPLRIPALSPGMYEFDLSRFAPVVTDADAYSVDATQRYLLPIYVPPAPSATPAFRAGQRFIEFSQPTGQAQTSAPGLHILTLKSIGHGSSGVTTLVFASDDGTASSVDTQSADVFGLSGLTPIVDDADVDSLVKRYAGRDVYPIADFWPICVFANGSEGEGIRPDPTSPLRIRSIVRLYGVGASWGLGPNILRMLDSGADYVTAGPVLVTFDIGRMDRSLVNHAFASYGGCAAFYSEFSGTWDLERALSFTSTIASHPEWSPPIVSEVKQHQVTVGMTRAMVIASVGYPSVYGTAAQMMKLDTWYYEMPPPASYTVYFKNDIVVKYDPPRMLP